ncbi:mediator of DNA damage checkpoint protein 1 isoform X2 [Clinocottus analis]|uniref:mediator of DNA damage checkpoint protein 1 isoform X2 n=1 Tax=Clinocottus analis TaxID=304258 RepID=UPI0035C08009
MDATQVISDSILESDEEENTEENENEKGRPLAKLCILKNEHIPETELPLFLGDNVVGRDPNTCSLPLSAPSISKKHATISLSVYRGKGPRNKVDTEALIWDLGSMNGTSKGHFKLTPHVRYALSERDNLVVADIPCQYVNCTIDTVSSKGHTMTPVSRNSGVNARWPDDSGDMRGDMSTGSQQYVNRASKSGVSLPGHEDTRKTPVRTSCLFFEQTPTQPEGTLVPESDSDSASDKEKGERRHKTPVSDSDSHISGPNCSTFLSPTNKIVPESEDESPITPSSSTKNRPSRHVSFSKEEPDVEMGQRQLKNKKTLAIVADSDEEEERATLEGRKSEESEQHVTGKQESNVSLTGEDEMPVFPPAVLTDAIPVFDMDSDTDMEGEEAMVAPAGPVTLNTNQQADQPPNTAQFHMDSDSDVDENALHEVPKSVPSSAHHTKPPHVISVIQTEGITMDSDTDVDDDDVSDTAIKANPASLQSSHAADSSSSTQRNDFHLDSDTDIEEEEEKQCGTNNSCSKIDETPSRLDIKPIESAPAVPHSLNLDSDTDDESFPVVAISELPVVSAVTESVTTASSGAVLDVLSDSDTEKEDNSSLLIPVIVSTLSVDLGTTSEALQSDSDADTDVDESSVPPGAGGVNPASLTVDSDTDVEDKEVDFGEAGENQIPSLRREITPGLLVPLQQNCSTPVQASEGELEDVETQAFLIPSSGPFRRARPIELYPCTDSLEDDLCVVAETQSFILQTRDCQGDPPKDHNNESTRSSVGEKGEQCIQGGSFQLGLSESSHLEGQAQALAMESTQAFVSVVEGANLEDTQAYVDRTSLENNSNLQVNGEDQEPARCPVMSEKEGREDLALEETQAYISEPNSETDEDERKNTATAETQPFHLPTSSTLAMAATQPMFALEEEDEESLDEENPISSVLQVQPSPQHVTAEREEHVEAAQPQKRHLHGAPSVAETQPMHVSENEESDDEDLIPQRSAKPHQLKEEQTQTLTNSHALLVETQPMHIGVPETQPMATSGNEESDVEDSIPGPQKRNTKQLGLEDEQTQTLTNSELSTVGTQPMDTGEDGESDEEDSIPGPRKRRAKPLQLEEESQPLTSSGVSVVETQPLDTCIRDQSDEELSIPGPRKRKAKARQLEEEETQPLTISSVSAVESQPMIVGESRKSRAKPIQEEDTQPLTNPEASTVEIKTVQQYRRGKGSQTETSGATVGGRRRTQTRLREEKEQAECSEPSKRPTRGKMKALPTTRGRRGKSRPEDEEEKEEKEEEEEVEQAKHARGKKYTRHQKDSEEEEEMLETERQNAENINLIKVQEKGREEQDKLERERKDREEQESMQAENAERFRLEQERAEKERIERERKEEDKKERADKAQKEKQLEKERKQKEEKERLEREKAEREEKERIEKERKKEEKLRLEHEKAEREEKERIEKERKKEEKLRLECEKAEREEKVRIEKERKKEEKLRLEREKEERKEKERIEKERKKEEKLRLEREKAEIEKLEREEKERTEKEREEEEEKERVKTAEREREERLERERKEPEEKQEKEAKEKQTKEQQENKKKENNPKTPAKGRRAAPRTTEPHEDSARLDIDDVPARRTRSRSSSSNSVSSERSASSVTPRGSRGRGRGAKRTSGPPQAAAARSSNRRTIAAEPTHQDSYDSSPQGVLSRSNSTSSEISSCSLSGGRGGRQRGRRRKTESDSFRPINSQSGQNLAPKLAARGRKGTRAEESYNEVTKDIEKTDSQQASTTRGRQRANANASKASAGDKKAPSSPECASEDSPMLKRNVRGRVPKVVKSETVETRVAPAVSDGAEAKGKRDGRKRELEVNTDEEASCSSKVSKAKEKAQTAEAAKEETKDESRVQVMRKGRASSTRAKKNAKDSSAGSEVMEESEKMEVTVEKRGRGRPSVVQKLKKEKQEQSAASIDQNTHLEESEPQTETSSVSRKRQALVDSSPVAKTRRASSASPAAGGQSRAARQAYKVLFTGVMDEEGERVLACLGGSMAKGVADMNFLVTDKVRRTVKFLCAVAKGVPIVNTHWLDESGKAGSFLSPNAFVVKDPEQEKKFNFCLQESLRIASSQSLLQDYEIHVTKSVKPEPVHMKDIISSSGATFLPKMPSSHKPRTVVISCEEDWLLCGPALSASLPVVTAEFILTGILRQKLDLQAHKLSAPANTLHLSGGMGRSKKKT